MLVARLESDFRSRLIGELRELFPGCLIFPMDQRQGIPDLLILYGHRWAALECKRDKRAKRQPNQSYYVELMDGLSFARFIYPENREKVLYELSQAFKS